MSSRSRSARADRPFIRTLLAAPVGVLVATTAAVQPASTMGRHRPGPVPRTPVYVEVSNEKLSDVADHPVTALRHRMGPDELINFYDTGPSAEHLGCRGIQAGSALSYACNP